MPSTQTVRPESIHEPTASFAFQHYARDFQEAYRSHKSKEGFSPAKLFLISRSIELAAKGLHLAQGKPAEELRKIDHNLEKACDSAVLLAYDITLTEAERRELEKANAYYEIKGFEYFLFKLKGVPEGRSGLKLALEGWPNLPDEKVLEAILEKLLIPKLC